MEFLVLRILRDIEKVPDPLGRGIEVEVVSIRLFPILSPIIADSPAQALEIANERYPTFRFYIAVQERREYERQSFYERERLRKLRNRSSHPSGRTDSPRKVEEVH